MNVFGKHVGLIIVIYSYYDYFNVIDKVFLFYNSDSIQYKLVGRIERPVHRLVPLIHINDRRIICIHV